MVYAYGFCLDDRRIKNAADPCSKCILDLQLHVLLCSCYVRCRFPYMSIIFRKVNIKRSFNRFCFYCFIEFYHLYDPASYRRCRLYWDNASSTRNPYYYFPCCHSYFPDQILESSKSKWLPVVLWTAYYNCFLWFLKQFLYITKYLFLVYLSVSLFWSYCL